MSSPPKYYVSNHKQQISLKEIIAPTVLVLGSTEELGEEEHLRDLFTTMKPCQFPTIPTSLGYHAKPYSQLKKYKLR